MVIVKVFEDNVLVWKVFEELGKGKILVVDGGGSMCMVFVGGNVVKLVEMFGWVGLVIFGCVCDVDEINDCVIGV